MHYAPELTFPASHVGYGWLWSGPSAGDLHGYSPENATPDLQLILLRIVAASATAAAVFVFAGMLQKSVLRASPRLRKAGIEFQEVCAHSFRIRLGTKITTFHPAKREVGYYESSLPEGILTTLVVLSLGGWLYLRLGYANFQANARPSWFQSRLIAMSLDASAAHHASEQKNPIQPTETNLLDGARLYRDKCADCHGRPDNPASDYGGSFYPPAPQFMNERPHLLENRSFYVIKYGVRWTAMPAWGYIMADSEIWQVVAFLNRLDNLPPTVEQELHRPAGSTP